MIGLSGLIEGATENLTNRLYGRDRSSLNGKIKFNFSTQSYQEQVSLIKQMEYVIGHNSYNSILSGDMTFFKEFQQKYGKDLFRFVKHRANRMLHPEKIKNFEEYFIETQNVLLERVFDKDFEQVKSLEDTKEYFKKLQNFELLRGKIKGDNTFKKYYEDKLEKAIERLYEKGIDKNTAQSNLEENKYKEMQFYLFETREETLTRLEKESTAIIIDYINIEENIESQMKDFQVFFHKNNDINYYLVTKNGNPIYFTEGSMESARVYFQDKNGKLNFKEDKKLEKDENDKFIMKTDSTGEIGLEEIELGNNPEEFFKVLSMNVKNRQLANNQKKDLKKIASTERISTVNKTINSIKQILKTKSNNLEKQSMVGGNENAR